MKRILVILTLACVAFSGFAQNNMTKAGLYDKRGNLVVAKAEPVMLNVSIRVASEHFTPGVYARYAQKYLGQRATLSSYSTIEIVEGRLAKGAAERAAVAVEQEPEVASLPLNKMSATAQTLEEQAAATAELIFALRKNRLDLITGEAGENVFGAGLKSALEEIARLEKECLDMFYGRKITKEQTYSFNIAVTPDKSQYMVCRFNDKEGIVAADDLAGTPVMVNVVVNKCDYPQLRTPGEKDKGVTEYTIVSSATCQLIAEATLLDTLTFVSPLYSEKRASLQIK